MKFFNRIALSKDKMHFYFVFLVLNLIFLLSFTLILFKVSNLFFGFYFIFYPGMIIFFVISSKNKKVSFGDLTFFSIIYSILILSFVGFIYANLNLFHRTSISISIVAFTIFVELFFIQKLNNVFNIVRTYSFNIKTIKKIKLGKFSRFLIVISFLLMIIGGIIVIFLPNRNYVSVSLSFYSINGKKLDEYEKWEQKYLLVESGEVNITVVISNYNQYSLNITLSFYLNYSIISSLNGKLDPQTHIYHSFLFTIESSFCYFLILDLMSNLSYNSSSISLYLKGY